MIQMSSCERRKGLLRDVNAETDVDRVILSMF